MASRSSAAAYDESVKAATKQARATGVERFMGDGNGCVNRPLPRDSPRAMRRRSEFEPRGRGGVDERLDHGLEEVGGRPGARRLRMDEARAHRGLLADDREDAAGCRQLIVE